MNYKTQVCREIVAARAAYNAAIRAQAAADASSSIRRPDLNRYSVKGAPGPVKRTRAASPVQRNSQGRRSEWSMSADYYDAIERDSRWSA